MKRGLTSDSTSVDKGHDSAISTGTLDREEMLELSEVSTENRAVAGSSTDNTMILVVT